MAEVQADYYEEMFREITKKFYYGDDDDLDTNEAMDKHEQILDANDFKLDTDNENSSSFGNNVSNLPNGYESAVDAADPQLSKFTVEEENWVCSDEALTWTSSNIASYSATQKLFRCNECECIGFLSRIAEHWLGSHANLRVFQCSQCPYASAWARCVKMHLARQHHDICPEPTSDEELQKLMKVSPVLEEVTKYLERLKSKLESSEEPPVEEENSDEPSKELVDTGQILDNNVATEMYTLATIKRYNCEHCSYATDRKDLFTRHENIHREEKPFQCNVCQKQFNRADHIKKHFIRMHRDHEYLLSNVRRVKTQTRTSNTCIKQKEKSIVLSTPTLVQESLPESALQTIIQRHIPTTIVTPEMTPSTTTTQIIQQTHPSVIQSTHMHEFLQQADTEQMDISFFGTHTLLIPADAKQAKSKQPRMKKYNIEKNVQCSYCTWTGADNWCLKRHLNTHLKPYVCSMCEYKAARSERLTTHIFRVHNKRACTKCSFLADDLVQLSAHQAENHKGMKSRKKLPIPNEGLETSTSTPVTSILQ